MSRDSLAVSDGLDDGLDDGEDDGEDDGGIVFLLCTWVRGKGEDI